MKNFERTVISQYSNSPTIIRLLYNFNEYLDPSVNLDLFYNNIWNIETARGLGLDIWGRIVGVGRVLNVASGKYFGFSEATNLSAESFNNAPFYSGSALTNNFSLTDDAYRVLIYAKALANISDGSTAAINQVMLKLFPGRGNCYIEDLGGMAMRYRFNFKLTPVESAIVSQSGILPKPAGVQATVTQVY